jgi:hypothetical protein
MYKDRMRKAASLFEKEQAARAYNNHVINEHPHVTESQPFIEWQSGEKWTVKGA